MSNQRYKDTKIQSANSLKVERLIVRQRLVTNSAFGKFIRLLHQSEFLREFRESDLIHGTGRVVVRLPR